MRASSLRRGTRLMTAAMRVGPAAGSRSNSVKIVRTCGTVTAGVFPPQAAALQLREPQRQQRQRDVMMPAGPAPHFVVRQADRAFAFLEQLFDAVPGRMDARQNGPLGLPRIAQGVPGPRLGL